MTFPPTSTRWRCAQAGIRDSLLRVSVGLESPGDIVADLARGLG